MRLRKPRLSGATCAAACIADTHLFAPTSDSDALFPGWMKLLPPPEQEALYARIAAEVRRAYEAGLAWLRERDAAFVVHLGDVTGGWGREGMRHPDVRREAARCEADLGSVGVPVRYCVGNHDLGVHQFGGSRDFSPALEAWQHVFGGVFWSRVAADMLALGIASPVADYRGTAPHLLRLKREQEAFLADTLAQHRDKRWTLFLHNPLSVRNLLPVLTPHRRRLNAVVGGDLHRPGSGNLLRAFGRMPGARWMTRTPGLLPFLRRTTVCPSTAPLWWRGYGALELAMAPRRIRPRLVTLERPMESEPVPTASLRWCWKGMHAVQPDAVGGM